MHTHGTKNNSSGVPRLKYRCTDCENEVVGKIKPGEADSTEEKEIFLVLAPYKHIGTFLIMFSAIEFPGKSWARRIE